MDFREALSIVFSVNKGDEIPDEFWEAKDIIAEYADNTDVEDAERTGRLLCQGYNEALRWRNPNEELPGDGELIVSWNGRYYEVIFYPEPPATDKIVAWIPLNEYKKEVE